MTEIDVVTGAFGYTGSYLAHTLKAAGHQVRALTNHPKPSTTIEAYPYTFNDRDALVRVFTGVTTFYNTYWVRYVHGGTTYDQAVKHTRILIEAAGRAGVERIVHISITKPSHGSFYEYYRGKAAIEDMIRDSGLPYAIVRPTVIFGPDDILVNNIAWLARRFHLFAIPGDGRYRVRPVYVQDLADLCVRLGARRDNVVIDAVGPETFTFNDMVRTIARSVGTWHLPVHLPPAAVAAVLRVLAMVTKDVILTRDEIDGLMAELVTVDSETTCPTRLTEYLQANAARIGASYHSELARRR
jgi:nucleoside-diphosphate-sugar epimerase